MSVTDVLTGLKNKVLDAATYELLRRNFELLEENNQQLKERVGSLKEECERLKAENLRLTDEAAVLRTQVDLIKRQEEFFEEMGFAFLKNPDGTVKDVAYCPECHTRLSTTDQYLYQCKKCDYTTKQGDARTIASRINERFKEKK